MKAALALISCDIPALRNVVGFVGHAARRLGFSKCLKEFPSINLKINYGGFDHTLWKTRSNEQHRLGCEQLTEAKTKTQLHNLEMKFGVRYSVLLAIALSYLDPVKFSVIDPMHNLLLGTARYVTKLYGLQEVF